MAIEFRIGKEHQTLKYEKGVWYLYDRGHRVRHLDAFESSFITGAFSYANSQGKDKISN
jgi:hypothetical protein